jgi:hypothetical protein
MISLKNITSNRTAKKAFNTDLFKTDREPLENFSKDDFLLILPLDSTSTDNEFRETALIFDMDNLPHLINIRQTSYNNEKQLNINSQELTLKGCNYFFKKSAYCEDMLPLELIAFYNKELKENKFDFSYEDVVELAEFESDLNCSILRLEDDEAKYFITVNSEGFLSKITKKLKLDEKKEEEKPKAHVLKSMLG